MHGVCFVHQVLGQTLHQISLFWEPKDIWNLRVRMGLHNHVSYSQCMRNHTFSVHLNISMDGTLTKVRVETKVHGTLYASTKCIFLVNSLPATLLISKQFHLLRDLHSSQSFLFCSI